MNVNRLILGIAILAPIGLVAFAGPQPSSPNPTAAAEFKIDQTHSSALFKVKHMGASWFYGRFNGISGNIQVDEKDPTGSYVLFTIDAGSVDTNSEKLNQHIKSSDFLDSVQFPEIVFESESVEKGESKDTLEVKGNLTLRGVTKPLAITVEMVGSGKMRDKSVIGYHTTFSIDRTDFGVNYGADGGGVGKMVELTISAEAYGE